MIKKLFVITLLLGLSGCALFQPTIREKLLPMEMTKVEGGTFLMGDSFERENDDSLPLHKVTLDDFYIGTYEVTYEQYDAFAKATERPLPRDDDRGRGKRAVIYVTWEDALAFCNAYGYRLPTEQEWEYAARSGGLHQLYAGTSNPDSLDHYARHLENSGPYAYLVGTKQPNELGLYDMSGNVSEYVGDYYPFYKTNPDSIQYYPLDERAMRVVRGGSFNSEDVTLRTYWRVGVLGDLEDHTVGFRCAVSEKE
ncbi:MAG: SUMF1/EgtB/PvdO family nonheme iron enzyme [Balneolaceae bacterium]|nr:SUMF1/EgtB/PvdO family nonheme iron enzyme [Balneolaceae bacterium]